MLRLPKGLPAAELRTRVAAVLQELGLGRVAGNLVGGAGGIRGVSGGERRRVTIGMELVTSPKLVIMVRGGRACCAVLCCVLSDKCLMHTNPVIAQESGNAKHTCML